MTAGRTPRPPGPERSVGLAARLPPGAARPPHAVPATGLTAWRTPDGLAVLARGSSTCPPYPVALGYEPTGGSSGRPRVRVDLDDAYPGLPCTRDLVATTHVLPLPQDAPAEGHLELLLVLGDVRERVVVH